MKNNSNIKKIIIKYLETKRTIPKKFKIDILKFEYLDYGQIDSLEVIDFIIFLKKKFKINLTSKDIHSKKFRTIGGLIEIILDKLK
jgi:acyl carrier protein